MEMEKARLQHLGEKIPMLFSLYKGRQEAQLDRIFINISSAVQKRLAQENRLLDSLTQRIRPGLERWLMRENYRLDLLSQRAKALDPALLLRRGYSMTTLNGHVVKDKSQLKPGDEIVTRLEKGTVTSIIK